MPTYIIKISHNKQDFYMEWSTVVDAPVSRGLPLKEFKKHYLTKYGTAGLEWLSSRLERVDQWGTSCALGTTPDGFIAINRAGPKGRRMSLKEIINIYRLTPQS